MEKIWDQAQLEEWLVRETGKQQGDSTAPEQVLPNGLLCPLGKVELPAQPRAEMSWSLGPQQCSVAFIPAVRMMSMILQMLHGCVSGLEAQGRAVGRHQTPQQADKIAVWEGWVGWVGVLKAKPELQDH